MDEARFRRPMPEIASTGGAPYSFVPVQFLADHLEILYDVDVELREQAEACGLSFLRVASLMIIRTSSRRWPLLPADADGGTIRRTGLAVIPDTLFDEAVIGDCRSTSRGSCSL